MDKLLIISVIMFCLSDAYFCPLRDDAEYKKLFVRNFPLISLMSVIYFVFFLVYIFISEMFFPANYIDTFYNTKIYLFFIFYTIIIFVTNMIIVTKELINSSSEAKNSKILLIPAILLFLFTSSVIWGIIIIHSSNSFFDFSTGEEQVSNIYSGQISTSNSWGIKTNRYYLDVSPDIYGLRRFVVSGSIFNKAKIWSNGQIATEQKSSGATIDMNGSAKLRVWAKKGLYGIRYFSNSMEVVK